MKKLYALILIPSLGFCLTACGPQSNSAAGTDADAIPAAELITSKTLLPAVEHLPLCPGWQSATQLKGDARTGSVQHFSSLSAGDLHNQYSELLSANGWFLIASSTHGRDHHLQFRQHPQSLRLHIRPATGRAVASQALLAWARSDAAPDVLESQAPDFEEELSDHEPPSFEW